MEMRKVWRVIDRASIPKGRRLVKSKWVFDLKRSGLFKVRLVACGYSQIPGVDFTESYAPVINALPTYIKGLVDDNYDLTFILLLRLIRIKVILNSSTLRRISIQLALFIK